MFGDSTLEPVPVELANNVNMKPPSTTSNNPKIACGLLTSMESLGKKQTIRAPTITKANPKAV